MAPASIQANVSGERVSAACWFVSTTVLIWVSVACGVFLLPSPSKNLSPPESWTTPLCRWDGEWYAKIAQQGYDADDPRCLAFFPVYPLLGRLLAQTTGMPVEAALLILTYVCLAAVFFIVAKYVRERCVNQPSRVATYAMASFALFPTTFFFRMAYTEALFCLLAAVVLFGMERRWPVATLAFIVGLATATRPTGIALIPPMALHVWCREATPRRALARLVWLLPLSCWGLAAYMFFQYVAFDNPLAFIPAQMEFRLRPPTTSSDKLLSLLSWEPIWSVYDANSDAYWRHADTNAWLSLRFANPIYFLLTAALIGVGAKKKWLSTGEAVMSAGLLAMPYVTRSFEMCMSSQGRFAAVIVPAHLVIGQVLSRLPAPIAYVYFGMCGTYLGIYSAAFAARYALI